jgi:hypothetical protein
MSKLKIKAALIALLAAACTQGYAQEDKATQSTGSNFAGQKCPLQSFNDANFSKVEEGMSAAQVNEIFRCQPAVHLTIRKDYAVQLFWTTIGIELKWVQIWFDKDAQKVTRVHPKFDFKEKVGF